MQRKHTLKALCFCEKFALKNARWKKVDIKRQWAGPDVLTVFELQALVATCSDLIGLLFGKIWKMTQSVWLANFITQEIFFQSGVKRVALKLTVNLIIPLQCPMAAFWLVF